MSGSPAERAFVGLGSNLDDPHAQLGRAFIALDAISHTRLLRRSRLYRSEPWGLAAQPAFVNAVAELSTTLEPAALLEALLGIERAQGRLRGGERWGPRTLDLDLLVHGTRRLAEPGLVIPHPHLAERAFVLAPLAELDPDLVIPGHGRVAALLARIDRSGCEPVGA